MLMKKLTLSAVAMAAMVGLLLTPASPALATSGSGSATSPKHCAVLLTSANAAAPEAPATACSTTSAAVAKAALPAAAATKTLLMTGYEKAGYGGGSIDFYGTSGHCDADGYDFNLTHYGIWAKTISSIRGYQTCNAVVLHTLDGRNYIWHDLSWSFGGTIYNDNVSTVAVVCGRNC
jgi:hypothetical protein